MSNVVRIVQPKAITSTGTLQVSKKNFATLYHNNSTSNQCYSHDCVMWKCGFRVSCCIASFALPSFPASFA